MATGRFPNEGRFTRRRSPLNVTANRPTQRFGLLVQTTAGATNYGASALNANRIANDYFWGIAASTAPPVTFGVKPITVQSVSRAAVY